MILYELGLKAYNILLKAASPFHAKAKLWYAGREGIFEKMREEILPTDEIAWFHCASLGEFEQGRPLIEAFGQKYQAYKILITFFSPSGYEVRKNYKGAHYIFYLPVDTRQNAETFIRIVRPKVAVFIKYEFWKNYLSELHKFGTKTYVVSAVFRPGQVFFRWYGGPFRNILTCFDRIFVQDRASEKLLASIGIDNVTVAGDTRFDRVGAIAQNALRIEPIERFAEGGRVLVAGSTWPKDDEIILEAIANHPEYKFIIAPHEMDEAKIVELTSKINRKQIRYSKIQDCSPGQIDQAEVFILDTIGILSSVYRYGTCAYIGGGFGKGIHNILEAAAFGLPLMFGPNYKKFREAVELIELRGAESVNGYSDVDRILSLLAGNEQAYKERSAVCKTYVETHTGASKKILDYGLI